MPLPFVLGKLQLGELGLAGFRLLSALNWPVRAEVRQLAGFSGHADRNELLAWLRQMPQPPQQTFVVHGEPDAADALRSALKNELGWQARVPVYGESVDL